MSPLDINPEGEKEGIISAGPQVPKLNKPFETKKITSLALTILAIFVVVGILIYALNMIQQTRTKSYTTKISDVDSQISTMGNTKNQAEAIYGQVKNLKNLWDNRNLWSNVMKEVSSNMIAGNKIDLMTVDEQGKTHIKGASASYMALAKLFSNFENNNKFSNIRLINASSKGGTVSYDMEMNFSTSMLMPTTKEE